MQWNSKTILTAILVIIAIIGVLCIVGMYLQYEKMQSESFSSRYSYSATLTLDKTLDNVTLMLPLPSFHESSQIGDAIVAGEAYGIPDDWDCSLVEVDGGVMLKIEAEQIIPDYQNHIAPIPIEPGEELPPTPVIIYSTEYSEETPDLIPIRFGVSIFDMKEIDTKNPLGNEPIISSKQNLTQAENPSSTPGPSSGEGTASFYHFESPIYAAYDTDPDTTVSIEIGHRGENSWWVLGWSGNRYTESFGITLTGPDPGWQYGSGSLSTGEGRYR